MDDLSRAWAILNLPPGSSAEAIRNAYRDLIKKWHPDQFQNNPDRLDEAHEMLKELNWAHDYLRQNARAVVRTPEEPPAASALIDPEDFDRNTPHSKVTRALAVILVLVLAGGFAAYLLKPGGVIRPDSPPANTDAPVAATPPPTQGVTIEYVAPEPASDHNIVRRMRPAHNLQIASSMQGFILRGTDTRDALQTTNSLRPPFVFRATVQTDTDLRFYYGLGLIIFNWADNPTELRVHDLATSAITAVKQKGALSPGAFHDLVVNIQTNSLTVSVDGDVRFQTTGYYVNLNTPVGIGPHSGVAVLKSVSIDSDPTTSAPASPQSQRPIVPGDLLATMTPHNDVQVTPSPEGRVLSKADKEVGYLKTPQTYRPPFIIRTRAKTDSIDLRLYCGSGFVIFNWESNPGELRVHDPATGKVTAIANRGRILPNQWHDFVWEVHKTGLRLLVDGQVRYQTPGDYTALDVPAGIGPFLSKVTVANFRVEQR